MRGKHLGSLPGGDHVQLNSAEVVRDHGEQVTSVGPSCYSLLRGPTLVFQYWKSAHPAAETEAGLLEGRVISEDVSRAPTGRGRKHLQTTRSTYIFLFTDTESGASSKQQHV